MVTREKICSTILLLLLAVANAFQLVFMITDCGWRLETRATGLCLRSSLFSGLLMIPTVLASTMMLIRLRQETKITIGPSLPMD
jgi:hypothetical protein